MAAPAIQTFKQQALAARERIMQRPRSLEQQIAARAYEIYVAEGRVDGNHERHWFQAVEELTREAQPPVLSATAR